MSARTTWTAVFVLVMLAFAALAGAFVYLQRLSSDQARLTDLSFSELLMDVEEVERSGLDLRQSIAEMPHDVDGIAALDQNDLARLLRQTETLITDLTAFEQHGVKREAIQTFGQFDSLSELGDRIQDWRQDLQGHALAPEALDELDDLLTALAGTLNGLSLIVMERSSHLSELVASEIEALTVFSFVAALSLVISLCLILRLYRKTGQEIADLSKANTQIVSALNTLGHGFALFDSEDRLVLYNDWYRRFGNLPMTSGMTFEDTIRVGLKHGLYADPETKDEAWIAARLAQHRRPQGAIIVKMGDDRWVEIDERRTGEGGRAGLRIDVTEHRQQIQDLQDEIERQRLYLRTLRSATALPLSVIETMLSLLSESRRSPEDDTTLDTAKQAQSLLARMIDDLPHLVDPKSGPLTLLSTEFEVERLWRLPIAFLGGRAESNGVTLIPNLDSNIPERLRGDPSKLLQVILILLDHALAEVRDGTLSLDFSLTIPQGSASSVLLLKCEIALAATSPSRARWSALLNSKSTDAMALGATPSALLVARRLAEAIGASLRLDEGFVFEAPIDRVPARLIKPVEIRDRPILDQSTVRFHGDPRVLVVEDDDVNRRLILAYLQRMGVRAEAVDNGAAAVELADRERFDLVLMDIILPKLNGFGATEAIRGGGGACRDVPILALTANAKPADVAHCMSSGMNGHIAKPVDPVRLLQAMQRWMKVSRETEPEPLSPDFDQPLNPKALADLVKGAGGALASELIGDFLDDLDQRMAALQQAAKEMDSDTLVKVSHSIKGSAGLFGASELEDLANQIEAEAEHLSRGEAFRLVSELAAARDRSRDALGDWQTQHTIALDGQYENLDHEPKDAGEAQR